MAQSDPAKLRTVLDWLLTSNEDLKQIAPSHLMIFVGQHSADLRHCHSFINQKRFGGSVLAKDFDEDLLNGSLFYLLDGQTDLLSLHLRSRVLRALG